MIVYPDGSIPELFGPLDASEVLRIRNWACEEPMETEFTDDGVWEG